MQVYSNHNIIIITTVDLLDLQLYYLCMYILQNCELNPILEKPESGDLSGDLSALILHIVPRSEVVIASKLGIE